MSFSRATSLTLLNFDPSKVKIGTYITKLFLGQLLGAVYQYLVPIHSPVIDNIPFLNKRKRENNSKRKNAPYERVDLGSACI